MNYERLLAPLRRRMATLIGRCILSAVRSGEGFQTLDVVIMADENMGGVEHAEAQLNFYGCIEILQIEKYGNNKGYCVH